MTPKSALRFLAHVIADVSHLMTLDFRSHCIRAIAHLKFSAPQDDSSEILSLSPNDRPVTRSLGHGLVVVYLVDEGDQFSFVQHRHLSSAGLSENELHQQAMKNLLAFAEAHVQVVPHGSIWAVLAGGNFEASMLLLDAFWTDWYGHIVPNGIAVAFPARDLLAFGDASSPSAVAELRAVCDSAKGKVDHPLSPSLFRKSPVGWEPFGG